MASTGLLLVLIFLGGARHWASRKSRVAALLSHLAGQRFLPLARQIRRARRLLARWGIQASRLLVRRGIQGGHLLTQPAPQVGGPGRPGIRAPHCLARQSVLAPTCLPRKGTRPASRLQLLMLLASDPLGRPGREGRRPCGPSQAEADPLVSDLNPSRAIFLPNQADE